MLRHKITKVVESIPLFPQHIDKLLQAAVKPTNDNIEVLRHIAGASDIWSELLRVLRVYYGDSDDIKTVEDAINCGAIQPLVQLIGVAYARKAIEEEFASLKYLNEYFDHSEHISIGCSVMAQISNIPKNEQYIYTAAGLIHDIGRLALMVADNRTSAHVLGTLWDKMASVVYEEKERLSTDHCEVGRQICQKWNLSPIIQQAVLRHHTPIVNGDFSFGGAIIFISHFLSASDPSGDIVSSFPSFTEILLNLKLTQDDFNKARKTYKERGQSQF